MDLDGLISTLGTLFMLATGMLPLFGAIAVAVIGFRRLRGHRSGRLDRIADTTASAVSVGVYPPSLRGGGPVVPRSAEEGERLYGKGSGR